MGKKSAKKKTTWRAFSLDGEGRKRPSQHQHHAATGNGGSPATEGAGAAASSGGKSEVSSWRRKVIADSISGSETNGGTTASSSTSTTTPQGGGSHHHHQQQQHYYNGYDYHQPYAGRRPWRSPGPGAPYRGGGGRRASGGPRGYHNQSSHFHTASPYHQRLRYDAGRINSLEGGDVPDAFTEGYVVTSADQLPSFLQAAASVDGDIPANVSDESYWTEEQQAAAGYFNPYNVYPCFTSPNSPPVLLSPPYHQLMWYEDPRLPPDCQYYFCLTQPFPPPPSYSPPDGGGGGGGSAGEEDGTGTGTSAEGSTVPTTPESEQQEVEVDSGETSSAAAVESAPDSLSPSATPSGVGVQQQVVPPSPPYIYPGNFMFRPYIYPTTSGHGPFWNWTDNEGPRRFVRRHRRRPFIGGEGITFDRWPSRKNGTQTDDKCNRQNSSLSSSTSDLVSIPATTTTAAMNGDSSPQQQNNQGQENAVSDAGGAANGLERHDVSERTIAATAEQATTIDAPPTDDAGSSPSTEADTVIRRNVTDSSSAPLALDDNVSAVDRSPKIQQQQQQPQPLPPPPPLQQRNLVHQTSRDNLTDDRQKVTTTKPEAKTPRSGEPKPQSSPKSSNGRKKTPPQQQQQQQQQPQPPTTEGVDKTKSAPSRNVDRKTPPRGDSRSPKEKRQGGRGKQNKSANQTNGPAATSNGAESQQQEEEVMVVTSTDSDVIRSGGGVVVKMASTSVPSEEEAAAITAIAKPSDVKQEAVEEVEPVSEKISGLVELPVDDPAVGVDDELPAKSVTETVKEVAEKEVPRVHRKVVEAKVTPQPEVAVKSAVDSKFVLNEDADVFVPSSQPAKSEPTRGSPPDKLSSESGADCNGVANGHCNPVTTPVVAANGPTTIAANANAAYRLESPVQYSKYYQLCSQYSMDDLDDVGRLARDETPANAPLGVAGTRRSSSNSNGSVKSHHVLPPGGNEIVLHEATDSASECGSEDVEMIGHRYETAADRIYKNNTVSLAAELLQSSGGQLPYGSPASECRTNSHVLEGFYGSRPAPAGAAAAGPPSGSKSNGHCAGQPTEDGAMVAPRSGDWRRRREAGDSGIHTDESADDDDGGHKMALAAALDEDEPSPYVPPRFAAYGFMVLWWTSFALISFSHEPH